MYLIIYLLIGFLLGWGISKIDNTSITLGEIIGVTLLWPIVLAGYICVELPKWEIWDRNVFDYKEKGDDKE